jgi:hypothetical protein
MIRLSYLLPLLVVALVSCGQSQPSIDFGKAECAHCRMNVVDRQYGAALVTEKGRQYVFDDVSCMLQFVANGTVAEGQVQELGMCATIPNPGTSDRCQCGAVPARARLPQSDARRCGGLLGRTSAEALQPRKADAWPMDWSAVRQLADRMRKWG